MTVVEQLTIVEKTVGIARSIQGFVKAWRRIPGPHFAAVAETVHKITHLLRDSHFCLQASNAPGNVVDPTYLTNELERTGQGIVDHMEDLLTTITDRKVSACIKMVDDPPTNVYTLCRSKKSERTRFKRDWDGNKRRRLPVSGNTAFVLLMNNDRDAFAIPDLKRYDKDLQKIGYSEGYQNITPNWSSSYRSTIVVPIRIESRLVGMDNAEYDVLGFLCVDSLATDAFPEKLKDRYVNLMLAVADDLYLYLFILLRLREESVKNQANDQEVGKNGTK